MRLTVASDHLLVVDDDPVVRETLARGLWHKGFRCLTAPDGHAALALLQEHSFALLLSDIRMPGMDGLTLLPQALALDPDLHVILVTALAGIDTALAALRCGAYDYLTKPVRLEEVDVAVRRALDHRRLLREARQHTQQLEALVAQRTRQVQEIAVNVITSFGLALEAKDEWTHDHSRRVAELAYHLGQALGLPEAACAELRLAGLLHDIGKIGVREAVLLKPEALTAAEFAHIKQHPELGARILSPLVELKGVLPYIRHHHERWDGGGYPQGLAGEAIPYGARILGVADAYVAMREDRPYRKGRGQESALVEVQVGARRQFDVHVVGALVGLTKQGKLEQLDEAFPQELPTITLAS